MRVLIVLVAIIFAEVVSAQTVDSVRTIYVRYTVERDMKKSLRELEGPTRLEEFVLIVHNKYVITKETPRGGGGSSYYTFWDTENQRRYRCFLDSTGVTAALMNGYYDSYTSVSPALPDSIRKIKGLDCKAATVMANGERLDVWYTTTFGVGFSPIAKLEGVPLYFEKVDPKDGRLSYTAVEVEPLLAPASYFDIDNFSLFDIQRAPSRRKLTGSTALVHFARKGLDGQLYSTGSLQGEVMFLTFQPFKTTGDDVDFGALNALKAEFSDMPVEFVSVWKGSTKNVEEALTHHSLDFRHLPKCGQVYVLNNIVEKPTHLIVDKRGLIRYKYTGYFGRPLFNAMKRDLASLLPKSP